MHLEEAIRLDQTTSFTCKSPSQSAAARDSVANQAPTRTRPFLIYRWLVMGPVGNFGSRGMNLPTAVRQCHPDCTASTAEPDAFQEEDRTPHVFKIETDRDGLRLLTPALMQFPAGVDGCLERCTTTYVSTHSSSVEKSERPAGEQASGRCL